MFGERESCDGGGGQRECSPRGGGDEGVSAKLVLCEEGMEMSAKLYAVLRFRLVKRENSQISLASYAVVGGAYRTLLIHEISGRALARVAAVVIYSSSGRAYRASPRL